MQDNLESGALDHSAILTCLNLDLVNISNINRYLYGMIPQMNKVTDRLLAKLDLLQGQSVDMKDYMQVTWTVKNGRLLFGVVIKKRVISAITVFHDSRKEF